MKVAMVQMQVIAGEVEVNRRNGLNLCREAAGLADVVVMPEIWTTGYQLKQLEAFSEAETGPIISEIKQIAQQTGAWVVAGSLPLRRSTGIFNTSLAIAPDGTIAAQYDKMHMFSLYGESKYFHAGSKRTVFPLLGTMAGLGICYDIRFPELFRSLTIDGAEIIFVAAEWPSVRSEHWRLLNQTRALENQVYVVAVNCVGAHKGLIFHGHSMIISPDGVILTEGSDKEEIIVSDIDLTYVAEARKNFSVWQDRRPELYS